MGQGTGSADLGEGAREVLERAQRPPERRIDEGEDERAEEREDRQRVGDLAPDLADLVPRIRLKHKASETLELRRERHVERARLSLEEAVEPVGRRLGRLGERRGKDRLVALHDAAAHMPVAVEIGDEEAEAAARVRLLLHVVDGIERHATRQR